MKWVLIIYFFVAGPGGGWVEVDREYYINKHKEKQHVSNLNG